MYKATMPEGMQEASYCYKNSSIYFNSHISNEDFIIGLIGQNHKCKAIDRYFNVFIKNFDK